MIENPLAVLSICCTDGLEIWSRHEQVVEGCSSQARWPAACCCLRRRLRPRSIRPDTCGSSRGAQVTSTTLSLGVLPSGSASAGARSVVVENQPAAGLTIGSGIAAKAAPDGYTLLLADRTSLAAAPHLYRNLRYDPSKDFRPITLVARAPNVLVTNAGLAPVSLHEFLDDARRQPQPILFAGAGVGTVAHLAGELFRQLAKIDMQIVQYRGGVDAALAVLKSEAKVSCVAISVALPNIEAGNMRALAIASSQRFVRASYIPTSAEAGLPGFEAEQWLSHGRSHWNFRPNRRQTQSGHCGCSAHA